VGLPAFIGWADDCWITAAEAGQPKWFHLRIGKAITAAVMAGIEWLIIGVVPMKLEVVYAVDPRLCCWTGHRFRATSPNAWSRGSDK